MLKNKTIIKKIKALKKKASFRPKAKAKMVSGSSRKKKVFLPKPVWQIRHLSDSGTESSVATRISLRQMPLDLPKEYGQDKIIVLVRDPRWIYTYWEIAQNTFDGLKKQLGDKFYSAKIVLRVYDITNISFDGTNARSSFDVSINEYTNNCYIETSAPGESFCVDLGYLLPDGKFLTIVRSNLVRMPSEGASDTTDEEWLVPDEMFARLYGMGFGLGRSSPVGKTWQDKVKHILSSKISGSADIASRHYLLRS